MDQKKKTRKLSADPEALSVMIECLRQGYTDKEIQQKLIEVRGYKWSVETISRKRRKMGVIKQQGQPLDVSGVGSPMLKIPPHGMSDVQKASWFRDQFKASHMYVMLKKQFEPEEVAYYLEDFGLLCCQFEDIVVSEFMQIDDLLKQKLQVSKQLILIKTLNKELEDLKLWLGTHPPQEDESKEVARQRAMQQRRFDSLCGQLKQAQARYDELLKAQTKMYDGLAATRKDRLDELRGGKETFLELIARLQNSQAERDRQGKFAELTKIAADDVKHMFRQPTQFPDDMVEPILMDGETNFGENYE